MEEGRAELMRAGMAAVRTEEFMLGYVFLSDAYRDLRDLTALAAGLSYYGLAIALMDKKFKPAIELCNLAIEAQFYNADHYLNLSKVYEAAGSKRKAIETLDRGLAAVGGSVTLRKARDVYGYRGKPAFPFLDRSNPLNRALGRARAQAALQQEDTRRAPLREPKTTS